jgi:phage terminase large subunit
VDALVRINQKYRPDGFYVDPSAAGLIAEMQTLGLPVHGANNDISQGIQVVKARLVVRGDGLPGLTVEPDCIETISEYEAYVWARDKHGEPLDKPLKENDHAMDAARYGALGATVVQDSFSVLEY